MAGLFGYWTIQNQMWQRIGYNEIDRTTSWQIQSSKNYYLIYEINSSSWKAYSNFEENLKTLDFYRLGRLQMECYQDGHWISWKLLHQ